MSMKPFTKSESTCETLLPEETAVLMSAVHDPELFAEMSAAADRIKKKVYDNRIVVFAPLYDNFDQEYEDVKIFEAAK